MLTRIAAGMVMALFASVASAVGLTQLGQVTLNNVGDGSYVAAEGRYAYVSGYTNQGGVLIVVDILNPAAPVEVSRVAAPYGPTAVRGRYVYVISGGLLTVVDVATPAAPVIVGSISVASSGVGSGIRVTGGYAYVANGVGLHIIDVSNPAALIEVTTLAVPAAAIAISEPATTVCTAETYAYLSSMDGSFTVVNVTQPAAPRLVSTIALGWGEARGVATSGQYAYVASFVRDGEYGDPSTGKLHVIDVTNPAVPVVVGSRLQSRACHTIAIAGGYAYMVEESIDFNSTYDDTSVVDVRAPTALVEVARMRTPRAWDLALVGSDALVPQNGYPASLVIYRTYAP